MLKGCSDHQKGAEAVCSAMRALLFEVGGGAMCDGGDGLTCCIGTGELPHGRNRLNLGPTRSPTLHYSYTVGSLLPIS